MLVMRMSEVYTHYYTVYCVKQTQSKWPCVGWLASSYSIPLQHWHLQINRSE